jgi:serine/threonine-protein kinase
MGEVYRARDSKLKREVALKVLEPSVTSDRDRIARFQREAELLAAVNHPNIASIHGVEEASGSLVLVMELVLGEDLAARIARGPIPLDEAVPIARQIAGALEAAHERGIIHRDLKPANIKVRDDGTVKVLDFGLAKAAVASGSGHESSGAAVVNSPTVTSPAMTAAGVILGTAAYMSPEQARGRAVDKRSDVWAFGAVFFEMITGRRAFPGEDVSDVIASVLAREPDWSQLPAGLSPTLSQYLRRCLERDPKRRVRDMGDVLLALDGAFDTRASTAQPTRTRPLWRRALPIAAAAVAGGLIAGLAMRSREPASTLTDVSRFEMLLPSTQELRGAQRSVIAVAPDGRAFAYKTLDGIRLRLLGELEPRLITGTSEADGSPFGPGLPFAAPFFSPDGQWIAFFTDGGLRKVGIAGGTPIAITSTAATSGFSAASSFGASWSRDNTILFGQPAGIMRVSADGGTPEVIVPATHGEQLWRPQMLPGGQAVLFSVVKPGTGAVSDGDIAVQSLSSGHRTVIVRGGSDARYISDGYLVYGVQKTLMAVPFDARRLTNVGSAVPIAQDVERPFGIAAGGVHYGVSDRGILVYLADNLPRRSLRWVNRDGTPGGAIDAIPPGAIEDPRLSPDGGRLLVTRDGDIWIYDLASGRGSKVTKDGRSQMGVWDPTGTRVAYSSRNDVVIEAWIVPVDGSAAPRQVTHDGGLVHVDSWSPDGRTLSVHRHAASGVATILMIPVDAPDATPVTFAAGDAPSEGASFSRDGRFVAYISTETGKREIYIRPYPGPGGRVTVSVNGGAEPQWAANGDVFYRSVGGDRMFTVAVSTTPTLSVGKVTELFKGSYYVSPTGSPRPQYDVTADGKRLLVVTSTPADAAAGRSRIVVVQNWLEDLKRRGSHGSSR